MMLLLADGVVIARARARALAAASSSDLKTAQSLPIFGKKGSF
jgi:hypothetical protein